MFLRTPPFKTSCTSPSVVTKINCLHPMIDTNSPSFSVGGTECMIDVLVAVKDSNNERVIFDIHLRINIKFQSKFNRKFVKFSRFYK